MPLKLTSGPVLSDFLQILGNEYDTNLESINFKNESKARGIQNK